jgi:hypothetical protein
MMSPAPRLKEKYVLALCCAPVPPDLITGYFSHDDLVKVHRHDCTNLAKTDAARLVRLDWPEISAPAEPVLEADFLELDQLDFDILRHHRDFDIDYSLMVAKTLRISKREAFDRHRKLRNLGLLERVDALMVRYRKTTAEHKWIKHRNHTYYRLTDKGVRYLKFKTTSGETGSEPGNNRLNES